MIEVLAAFVVLSVFFGVVTEGLVQARRGVDAVENRSAAAAIARALMDGPLTEGLKRTGRAEGTMLSHRWAMTMEPVSAAIAGQDPAPASARHRAMLVTIRVAAGRRGRVVLQTVRLVPVEVGS
jgi:hypothetical protein